MFAKPRFRAGTSAFVDSRHSQKSPQRLSCGPSRHIPPRWTGKKTAPIRLGEWGPILPDSQQRREKTTAWQRINRSNLSKQWRLRGITVARQGTIEAVSAPHKEMDKTLPSRPGSQKSRPNSRGVTRGGWSICCSVNWQSRRQIDHLPPSIGKLGRR